ncbi:transcriptional regulator domain-containing protein [Burkholderia latens]|uniref:transcriptional regulator domain-containing protein n=1 Tax=Burkholderia TaxID=32008 RepID=UPI0039A4E202
MTSPIRVQHPVFVARVGWRDESQYPRTDLLDPSIWSWEFLGRSDEYAQEFDLLHPF